MQDFEKKRKSGLGDSDNGENMRRDENDGYGKAGSSDEDEEDDEDDEQDRQDRQDMWDAEALIRERRSGQEG